MTRAKCPHCTYATSPASIAAHVAMAHPDAGNVEAVEPEVADRQVAAYEAVVLDGPLTREQWLLAGVECLRSIFVDAGFPIPSRVRVSVGWPGGRGKKSGVIGQCWPTDLAGDGLHHIFISPKLTDPIEVLATLAHEPVTCGQVVGLHAWIDAQGVTRRACTRQGHALDVRRRFGRDRSALETAADHEYAGRYWAASAAGRR